MNLISHVQPVICKSLNYDITEVFDNEIGSNEVDNEIEKNQKVFKSKKLFCF